LGGLKKLCENSRSVVRPRGLSSDKSLSVLEWKTQCIYCILNYGRSLPRRPPSIHVAPRSADAPVLRLSITGFTVINHREKRLNNLHPQSQMFG
jgi:hypothetical protein